MTVNTGKLTARTLAQALRAAGRKIQQERRARQTPHGRQSVRQLMAHGVATSSIEIAGTPRDFERMARKWNVDYAFYKPDEGKHLLFFKSGQAEAITACFSEYSRLVLNKTKDRPTPILEQLKRATERVRQQPQREHTKEVAHEDR